MIMESWQIDTSMDAIIFDCDGTLSTIEGIDELARENGVSDVVEKLTSKAMGTTGINPNLYEQRLDLVRPHRIQVEELGEKYFAFRIAAVLQVIQIFQRLEKSVFIVSAGLSPSVKIFAELLKVPAANVFAVDIKFDNHGSYLDFDRESPMIHAAGKMEIVTKLKLLHPEITFIGDGLNDLVVHDHVSRFVGFGGAYYRENIAARCKYYMHTASMAPLLALTLTEREVRKLLPDEQKLYQKGLGFLEAGKVLMK
jgi:phosphoserine phosphatase